MSVRRILYIITVSLLLSVPSVVTVAQTPEPEYCYVVIDDFSQLEVTSGSTGADGSNVIDTYILEPSGALTIQGAFRSNSGISLQVSLDVPSGWNRLLVSYDVANTRFTQTFNGILTRVGDGAWYQHVQMPNGGTPSAPIARSYSIHSENGMAAFDLALGAANNTIQSAFLRLKSLEFRYEAPCDEPEPPPIYKPLLDADIDSEFGIWDRGIWDIWWLNDPSNPQYLPFQPEANMAVAMSNNAGDDVYSITGGYVSRVENIATQNCFGTFSVLGNCILHLDAEEITGDDYPYPGEGRYFYRIDRPNLYRVVVSFDEFIGYVEYIVVDAPNYVRRGQEISAGCIIGKTAPIVGVNILLQQEIGVSLGIAGMGTSLTFPIPPTGLGATFISLYEEYPEHQQNYERTPIAPAMVNPVAPSTACNGSPDNIACFGDPLLQDRNQWHVEGNATFLTGGNPLFPGGVHLFPMSQISAVFPLTNGEEYSMRVTIRRVGDIAGVFDMKLGSHVQSPNYANYDLHRYEIPARAVVNDVGGATVRVTNRGSTALEILSICISDGSASTRPDTCLFSNYSFDNNLAGWDVSGDVFSGIAVGEIAMGDGSTIRQEINLFPNGASAYGYNVYLKAFIPGGYHSDSTSTMQFDVTFGTETEVLLSPASTPTYKFSNFAGFPGYEVTFSAIVTVETAISDDFIIGLEIVGDTDKLVYVREVCIDDQFAFWDTGGGQALPFPTNCNRITPPSNSDDVGIWLYWHWSNLDRFFQCQLMVELNRIFNVVYGTYEYVRFGLLYSQAVLQASSDWMSESLFPWLSGHFHNMALGTTTTIITNNAECVSLPCLLDSLFSGLNSLLETPFDFLETLVNRVADLLTILLESAAQWISDILDALLYNATLIIERLLEVGAYIIRGIVDGLWLILETLIDIIRTLFDTVLKLLVEIVSLLLRLISELVGAILFLFLTFVNLVIQAIFIILDFVGTLLGHFVGLVAAIVNAQPQPIPGVTNCPADFKQNGFCAFLWMTENTIFQGEGQFFIVILTAYFAWELLEWIVGFYSTKIKELSDSL